jgi:hypothetical protein
MLIFQHEDGNFLDPATIYEIICTEFPSQKMDPELHSIFTEAIVHGPYSDEIKTDLACHSKWG